MIPLSSPDITDVEIAALTETLRSLRLSLGPRTEEFEAAVAGFVGLPHAVAVSSGTAGLHLCLLALKIGPGDEVIVPSFTFIAAANVIQYVGATPVFVDVDPSTLNMDPAQVKRAVTGRTRALMVVHTFGLPADLDELLAIARQHNLLVIEDACEAIGAEHRGARIGSFGNAAVFAFYPNKQITTGEGGMVVTGDESLARSVRALRNQGRYDTDEWLQHSVVGYNYRLSELHCALGCVQMSRLREILVRREGVAQAYRRELGSTPFLLLPPEPPAYAVMSWFVFVVQLHPDAGIRRDELVSGMRARGIQCGRYFAPVHLQPAYAERWSQQSLPVTEAVSRRTLALPFFTTLHPEQVKFVTKNLLELVSPRA